MPFLDLPSQSPKFPKDGTLDPVVCDFLYLFTIMAHPQDAPARRLVIEAVDAGGIKALIEEAQAYVDKAGRGGVNVSGALALMLAGAPDMYETLGAAVEHSAFGGRIAGLMLGYVVFRADRPETRATASLNSALKMVEEGCRIGRWKGGSRQNIKQYIWPTFRPVASVGGLSVCREQQSRCWRDV